MAGTSPAMTNFGVSAKLSVLATYIIANSEFFRSVTSMQPG